jgi:hypothetical protein
MCQQEKKDGKKCVARYAERFAGKDRRMQERFITANLTERAVRYVL